MSWTLGKAGKGKGVEVVICSDEENAPRAIYQAIHSIPDQGFLVRVHVSGV